MAQEITRRKLHDIFKTEDEDQLEDALLSIGVFVTYKRDASNLIEVPCRKKGCKLTRLVWTCNASSVTFCEAHQAEHRRALVAQRGRRYRARKKKG